MISVHAMGCVTGPKFGDKTPSLYNATICNFRSMLKHQNSDSISCACLLIKTDSQKVELLSPNYLFTNGSITGCQISKCPSNVFSVVEMENETNNWIIKKNYWNNESSFVCGAWELCALWPVPSKHRHYNYYETETDTANKIYKSKTAIISENWYVFVNIVNCDPMMSITICLIQNLRKSATFLIRFDIAIFSFMQYTRYTTHWHKIVINYVD